MEAFRIWLQEEPALFLGAAAALMLMSGSLYERQREHKTTQTLMLKGGTTLIAALVAGAAVWQQNSLAARFVLAATLCCAVADVLLEQIFNFGACVFALGHICYLAAYFSEAHFSIATAVSFVILLAGMYMIHLKHTIGKSGRENEDNIICFRDRTFSGNNYGHYAGNLLSCRLFSGNVEFPFRNGGNAVCGGKQCRDWLRDPVGFVCGSSSFVSVFPG